MMRTVVSAGAALMALSGLALQELRFPAGVDLAFAEEYAFSTNRAALIAQLKPETPEWAFYTLLNLQTEGRIEEAEAFYNRLRDNVSLRPYSYAFGAREALLAFDSRDRLKKPRHSKPGLELTALLWNYLRLHPDDFTRKTALAPDTYPSVLNTNEVSFARFFRETGRDYHSFRSEFRHLTYSDAIAAVCGRSQPFDPRYDVPPDSPGFFEAALAYLNDDFSGHQFSTGKAFAGMTLEQLERLQREVKANSKKVPISENPDFIATVLRKLGPGADEDPATDAAAKRAWTERVLAFARTLPPSQGELTLAAERALLELDAADGVCTNKALFTTYLKHFWTKPAASPAEGVVRALPAAVQGALASIRDSRRDHADERLEHVLKDFAKEDPLVTEYLVAFRRAGSDLSEFKDLVAARQLARVRCETDLLAGRAAADVDTSVFSDAEFAALKSRVELVWSKANEKVFGAEDPVSLDIDVKNVPKLRLAVYELDAFETAVRFGAEAKGDIDLDGCIPGCEETRDFVELSPFVRHREHYDLPDLRKPGVYVVECSGAGVSSRVLVRKGRLRVTERLGAAGHVFTALDEKGRTVKSARLRLGTTTFNADAEGAITVPFATDGGGQRTAIVGAGDLATTCRFTHEKERYSLSLGGVLPAETVLAGARAKILLAPRLSLAGRNIPLAAAKDISLMLEIGDRDGLKSTKTVEGFKVAADAEGVCEFVVPRRLASVRTVLTLTIRNLSANKDEKLSAERIFYFNSTEATEKTVQAFLRRGTDGYSIELRGRTGEPIGSAALRVAFRHRAFDMERSVQMQADAAGVIRLGALTDIDQVCVSGAADGVWNLRDDAFLSLPFELHAAEGESFELPARFEGAWPTADELSARVSLLAVNRAGETTADRIDAVKAEGGRLMISGLPAGDYRLRFRTEGREVSLRVVRADGADVAGGVIAGRTRGLSDTGAPGRLRLVLASVGLDGVFRARVENAAEDVRVHLVARRFQPGVPQATDRTDALYETLSGAVPTEAARTFSWSDPRSSYVSARDLGDKLRYILDRRSEPHRPGNMLEKPSLLLTPWSVDETRTGEQNVRAGGAWRPAADMASAASRSGGGFGGMVRAGKTMQSPVLDFLPEPAAFFCNLRPDKTGAVALKLPKGLAAQDFTVVAVDATGTDRLRVLGATKPFEPRDLTYRAGAAGTGNVVIRREGKVLDAAAARKPSSDLHFKAYDSVSALYGLLRACGNDDESMYAEFEFLCRWPKLPEAERLRLYGKYASHELDFFLYCKDRPFFDSVIAPNLRNKRTKRFMDRWLIGEDLSEYAAPGRLEELNALEKCLAAKRVKALAPIVARALSDACAAMPTAPGERDRAFTVALDILEREASDSSSGTEGCVEIVMAEDACEEETESLCAEESLDAVRGELGLAQRGVKMKSLVASRAPAAMKSEDRAWSSQRAVAEPKPSEFRRVRRENARGRMAEREVASRQTQRQLYRPTARTREWLETDRYRVKFAANRPELVPPDLFWRDYAAAIAAGTDEMFLSENVIFGAGRSLSARLGALAVSALPFEAKDAARVIAYRETETAADGGGSGTAGVIQRFVDPTGAIVLANGETETAYVTDEFVAGRVYELRTIVTNPSDRERTLHIYRRVPEGAMALAGDDVTEHFVRSVEAYSSAAVDTVRFYFPRVQEGIGTLGPASVTENGAFAGAAAPFVCRVVGSAMREDRRSWRWIARDGTEDEVIDFLKTANIRSAAVDLAEMGWRLKDEAFRERALTALAERGYYDERLWLTALDYNTVMRHLDRVRQILGARECLRRIAPSLGPWFRSSLVAVDPEQTGLFEHKEYWPLVNARTHALGGKATIVNEGLKVEYRKFLDTLAAKPRLDAKDRLLAAVFLLAQDRLDAAAAEVARVKPEDVETKMQLDYLKAYLAFSALQPEEGRRIAEKYRDYPVQRWRDRFRTVIAQADEIAGKGSAFDSLVADAASKAPSLALAVGAGEDSAVVTVTGRNVDGCTLKAYPTDVEVTFSKTPFADAGVKDASTCLKPAWSRSVEIKDGGSGKVELPENLRKTNLIVCAESADGRAQATLAVLSGRLDVQVAREHGQVRVRSEGRALGGAYVKVYAKDAATGDVKFHKDGYTDLRGVFDYASVSLDSAFRPDEFAVLVLHDTAGVKTFTVKAPTAQ